MELHQRSLRHLHHWLGCLVICLIVLASPLYAEHEEQQILLLIKNGRIDKAIDLYHQLNQQKGELHAELIKELGIQLLFEGSQSKDPEVKLMALFGSGISASERILPILEEAFQSLVPQHQLVALNFLGRYQNDQADKVLMTSAMRSQFLPIRLEAALLLCQKQYPGAIGQAESLMHKLPEELMPLFAMLFASSESHQGTRQLKQLMAHKSEGVRLSALLSSARAGRDDLLPQMRTLSMQLSPPQQESAAFALGLFKDEESRERLKRLSLSKSPTVRLAALFALYQMGDETAKEKIISEALQGDPFAIQQLAHISGSEEPLKSLMKSLNATVRVNATVALLKKGDAAALPGLGEILVRDSRDLCFVKQFSPGKSLFFWKLIPSASHNLKDNPYGAELSLAMREELLIDAVELPEDDFLSLAHALMQARQNDLIPTTVRLLENMQTEKAVHLLKQHSQQLGAPLIRNFCNLALYRLREPGPYYEHLKEWVKEQKMEALIKFRPLMPTSVYEEKSSFQLTAEESSRLLLEAFQSFVQTHDERGIDILLDAIRTGNPKNRYALAGLLIQTTL